MHLRIGSSIFGIRKEGGRISSRRRDILHYRQFKDSLGTYVERVKHMIYIYSEENDSVISFLALALFCLLAARARSLRLSPHRSPCR